MVLLQREIPQSVNLQVAQVGWFLRPHATQTVSVVDVQHGAA